MSATGHIDALAEFASGLHGTSLPAAVSAKARLCVLDALTAAIATAIAGHNDRAIAALAGRRGASGTAAVIGGGQASGETAAFLNASSSAFAICNDTHLASATHPGMVIVPCLLAAADGRDVRGVDFLAAVVAGYETMIRVAGAVVTPELTRVFRPTGIAGPLGAAAAVSRLFGLTATQAASAIALSANAAGGFNEWAHCGTEEHVFHAGLAARNAITMAHLAQAGVVAARSTLEGRSGLLAGFGASARAGRLSEGLGTAFRILEVIHKPVPACVFVQVPAMLAQELAEMSDFDHKAIEEVVIGVSRQAAEFPGCDNGGPVTTPAAAQQSIQFSVAAVLARGRIDHDDWARPADAGVESLCRRIRVAVDAEAAGPSGSGARLAVHLRDGSIMTASATKFDGMTDTAVVDRFLDLAGRYYGEASARAMLDAISALDTDAGLRGLLELMADGRAA